jgi:hypothetical protein
VAIALVVALLAIPDGAGSDFERGAPARPSASGTGQSAPPANSLPAPTEEAVDPGSPLIRGDDPVAALGALLDARAGCYRQLSTRCLAGIDQQGSAALSSDLLALQGMQGGGEVPPRVTEQPWRVQLVQRLGGSALMRAFFGTRANSKPAPILVMRTEAGWRIRDYLEE